MCYNSCIEYRIAWPCITVICNSQADSSEAGEIVMLAASIVWLHSYKTGLLDVLRQNWNSRPRLHFCADKFLLPVQVLLKMCYHFIYDFCYTIKLITDHGVLYLLVCCGLSRYVVVLRYTPFVH